MQQSFLAERTGANHANVPPPGSASLTLWLGAVLAFLCLVLSRIAMATPAASAGSAGELAVYHLGGAVGSFLLVALLVWVSSFWTKEQTQRRNVKAFLIASALLTALSLSSAFAKRAVSPQVRDQAQGPESVR
jgi:hypothetical protein